jgi:hypothetical protein
LNRLNIIRSVSYSPQSKGRVERIYRTLQDRLTKALRRQGISSIEEANANLPTFIADYNHRFSQPAAQEGDSHLSKLNSADLLSAFSKREVRRVTKQLTFTFDGTQYLIEGDARDIEKIGSRIEIPLRIDGTMAVFGARGQLNFRKL